MFHRHPDGRFRDEGPKLDAAKSGTEPVLLFQVSYHNGRSDPLFLSFSIPLIGKALKTPFLFGVDPTPPPFLTSRLKLQSPSTLLMSASLPTPPLQLWYNASADADWNRALPLGSGRLGAMIFGNVARERIALNEESVWSGGPRDRNNPDTLSHLAEIRRLILEGRLAQAHRLAADALAGVPDIMRFYEPLGDLYFNFDHAGVNDQAASGSLAQADTEQSLSSAVALPDYRRSLDLRTHRVGLLYLGRR